MSKAKIAILHPNIAFGGSERVVFSILETLQKDYNLTLITTSCSDINNIFHKLNKFCQTEVDRNRLSIIKIFVPQILKYKFDALRGALFTRGYRQFKDKFDLMFNTYGFLEKSIKGIQFIHDPSFNEELHYALTGNEKWFYKNTPFRRLYLKLCRFISNPLNGNSENKITIVNSKWTAKIVEDFFHLEPIVLYPPVPENLIIIPWEKKENGFIWIGRFTPEKKIEKVIKIIKKVRKQGFNTHLHIIGIKTDPAYFKFIKNYQKKYKHWISIEENKDEVSKLKLISKHRYGMSGRENEPFGIAIAEMVKAGCIVWVPKGGGQIEIVNHEDLIFSSEKDAVTKIEHTLSNKKRQYELLEHLKEQAEKFTVDKFKKEVKELVGDFFRNE